ncbi:putative NRPS-like enzyme [Aspergillus heterothallicus]
MGDFASLEDEPRLLPSLLDCRAAYTPDLVWAKFPVSPTSYEEGFRTATYAQMRNAVDRVAWLLTERLGPSTTFETLAYMGPGDLRYHIVLLAAVKAGYKPFFPSPRNSIPAQKQLLQRLETRVLITTEPEPVFVGSILREYEIDVVRIPALEELLDGEAVPPYPYDKQFDEAKDEPLFVLHTSGSTGIPKPLVYSHEFAHRIYTANSMLTSLDRHLLQGEWFSFLPAFHMAGIGVGFVISVYSKNIPVWPLPSRPPSSDSLVEALKNGSFTWAYLLPAILDSLSKDPAALDLVASKLKFLIYTGGALPESIGKIISTRIPTFAALGSSECGPLPSFRLPLTDEVDVETWRYLQIHPTTQPHFRPHMDDLHELVFHKSLKNPDTQPVFNLFPELDQYETRDLFSPHPTLPNLWRHRGRRDDIVVFLNGEKTNPVSFEEQVAQHPAVRAALVAGNQRFEACLLVEPASTETLDENAKCELVETIWSTVDDANSLTPAHARVSKSKILIMDPAKPMLRAGKGTIQRAGTVQMYEDEIEALYAEADDSVMEGACCGRFASMEDVTTALRDLVKGVTSWSEVEDGTDFFALGMDSLQVLRLTAAVRGTMGVAITQGVVYKNPSIDRLARHLYSDGSTETGDDRIGAVLEILGDYERQIDQLASSLESKSEPETAPGHVVVLTGSTGTLGSFILDKLLSDPETSHIYCLNRAQDSKAAQSAGNQTRKLTDEFPEDKVTFLTADLTKEHLGLDAETYTTIQNSTTQIIHNAWPVNFNQPLQYFQPTLDGVLNLVKLAQKSTYTASILFISSISAVSSYQPPTNSNPLEKDEPPPTTHTIPEQILPDPSCTAPMGYGESKYLAERILAYASTTLHIRVGIARIGQISGTARNPRGWSQVEWLPSLVVGSKHLGFLPESLGGNSLRGEIDWVPVDLLAPVVVGLSAVVERDRIEGGGEVSVFHCVNPNRVHWGELVPGILEELNGSWADEEVVEAESESRKVVTVSLALWVKKLQEAVAAGGAMVDRNPAAKLVEFYEQMLADGGYSTMSLCTAKTEEVSKELKAMSPIRPEWVTGWMREWLG